MLNLSLPRLHHHQLVPVYVGHNLPDSITLHPLLKHFEKHNFWPNKELSTIIDTPGKRHGKLFFNDSATAECAVAILNGTKVGSFTIVVAHWESRVKQPFSWSVVSVKLSNCHYSCPKERLESMVHKIDPTADVAFHQTAGTMPNWAHINCESRFSADKVVSNLRGTLIHGLPLSVKVVASDKQDTAASITKPSLWPKPRTAFYASVKVSSIPKSVTKDDILRRLSRISEVSVKVHEVPDCESNYAYVNCTDQSVAEEVVQRLNGRCVGGQSLRAKIVEQKTASSAVTVEPPKEQKSFNKPHEWEDDAKPFSLKDVPTASAEFNKVLLLMQKTLPAVQIMKVERIQNEWLWKKYSQHCVEIKKKNGGMLVEKELFHSSGVNDPHLIYQGEEGFDVRLCSEGRWGIGIYFAASAKSLHRYAYTAAVGDNSTPVAYRQMFLARVNVGETYECPPDHTLKMPPPKPSSQSATSSSVQFSVDRYDSVTGVTKDSRVYIVYDNRKAYPLYLISYTCT